MSEQVRGWLNPIFFIIWALWVFFSYIGYNPDHYVLFSSHPYALFLTIFGFSLAAISWWSSRRLKKKKKWSIPIRGITLIGVVLLLSIFVLFQFRAAVLVNWSDGGTATVTYVFKSIFYLLELLFLGIGLFALGNSSRVFFQDLPKNSLFVIAVGCLMLAFVSTVLGLIGILYGFVLWIVLLAAIFWQRAVVLDLLKGWFIEKHSWRIEKWWQLPVALTGTMLLTVYWLGGIKAFATGFDGAALYANLATLIADYNGLPGAFQPYSWSLVMSWGQLLFDSMTISLLLSHLLYVPALALAYTIIRKWLKPAYALLTVVLVLSLPMLGFQALVDEKVDLGLLYISLAVLFLLLETFKDFPKFDKDSLLTSKSGKSLLLLGLFLGFCFTIKYTSLFLLVGALGYLFWRNGGAWLFWSWIALIGGVIFLSGFYRMGNLPLLENEGLILGGSGLALGLLIGAYSFIKRNASWNGAWKMVIPLAVGFLITFSPWAGKHLAENQYQISVSSLLYGQPDRVNIQIPPDLLSGHYNKAPSRVGELRDVVQLTQADNQPDQKEKPAIAGNATREELQRYLGYEEGIWRYLSFPVDLSLGINVPGLRHQDIGFFFLLFLPLLLLRRGSSSWLRNLLVIASGIFLLLGFYWTFSESSELGTYWSETDEALRNIWAGQPDLVESSFVYFWLQLQEPFLHLGSWLLPVFDSLSKLSPLVFIPLFVLLSVPLSLAVKARYQGWKLAQKSVAVFLLAYTIYWALLGNSISWYAMLLWVFAPALVIYYLQDGKHLLPGTKTEFVKIIAGTAIGLQLAFNLGVAFSSSQLTQPDEQFYNWPMVEYACSSNLDQAKTLSLFDPTSQSVVDILNRDEDALIYRINTFLQFHIDKNDQRVFEDNQLQRFAEITNTVKTPENFIDVLRANGVRYLLYDINSPTLDRTPERSLVQKCNTLLNLLIRSQQAELILTDNYVENPGGQVINLPNGQQVAARPGLAGKTVWTGRVALFRIN